MNDQPIADFPQAQAVLQQLEAGAITARAARKQLLAAIPEDDQMTQAEARELLADFAAVFKGEAFEEMLKLLMADPAGGMELLKSFREQDKCENRCSDAEAEKLLLPYNLPFSSRGTVKRLLTTDRAAAERLLAGMPKLPKPSAADLPPAPQHDPASWGTDDDDEAGRVEQGNLLIKAVQKEGRYLDYTSAREEARRRRPALFC